MSEERQRKIQQQAIQQIVEGCIKNDRVAQKKLYDFAAPSLLPIAKRYGKSYDDAQHIFNQAFVKIFSSLQQVQDINLIVPWMKRVTINCALDYLRQNKRFFDKHLSYDNTEGSVSAVEGTVVETSITKLEMDEFLNLLKVKKPQHHLIFSLYHIYGFSHKEIAEKVEISQELSRYYLKEARKFLQNLLITL